jgi:hypothetical protein
MIKVDFYINLEKCIFKIQFFIIKIKGPTKFGAWNINYWFPQRN